jgi:type IV pilus assembly protein PilY1
MNKLPVLLYLLTVLIVGMLASHASADDTEVYVTASAATGTIAQPNVLFVFDTSGSMSQAITTQADFNPITVYGTSSSDYYYIYEQDYDYITSVHKSFVNCQALKTKIAAQPSNPVFNDRMAYWRTKEAWETWLTDGWNDISNASVFGVSNVLECDADSGVHGPDATSTLVYAADGAKGPYTSVKKDGIKWPKLNRLIAVSANYHDYLVSATATASRTKTAVMKDAAKDLVDDFSGLNFGLMRFRSDGEGGYVVHHFLDITPAANKTSIKT